MRPYYALGLTTLLVVFLSLGGVTAQPPVQLTDIAGSNRAKFAVRDLITFQGQTYTANHYDLSEEGHRFSLLNTASGSLKAVSTGVEFLGGQVPGRESGAFQIIDDKLFATSYTNNDGYEIFRIDGERATKLTDLPGNPVSELVSFQGELYFLATGPWVGQLQYENYYLHRLQLWRTDGTPEGTEKVEDLPAYASPDQSHTYAQLIAGENALLICGHYPEQPTSLNFALYRPGRGTTAVTLPADAGGGRAVVHSDKAGRLSIPYFAGSFYLVAISPDNSAGRSSLFQVGEEDGMLRTLSGVSDNMSSLGNVAEESFIVAGDKLFLHAIGTNYSYGLYRAKEATPTEFEYLTGSDETTVRIPAARHGDRIFFGGTYSGQPYLFTIGIADEEATPLVALEYTYRRWNLHFGSSVVYGTEAQYGGGVFRFDTATKGIRYTDGLKNPRFGYSSLGVSVLGDDLLFIGTEAENDDPLATKNVMVWRTKVSEPAALTRLSTRRRTGVWGIRGTLPDGRLLVAGANGGVVAENLYDPRDGAVTAVLPTSDTDFNSYAFVGLMDGNPVYTFYDYLTYTTTFYTVQENSLAALQDVVSGEPLSIKGYLSTWVPGLLMLADDTAAYATTLAIDGLEAARTDHLVAPGRSVTIHYSGALTAVNFQGGGADSMVVFTSNGSRLYGFILPERWQLAGFDEQGYTLYSYSILDARPRMVYKSANGEKERPIDFPEGVVPKPNAIGWQLGERLLFRPYNEVAGDEYYVADAVTGTLEILQDIHPGTADAVSGTSIVIDGVLYFMANDGTSGSELWRTDGTRVGTYQVADINPGKNFSAPDNFYATPSTLYFTATGTSGRETYRMTLDGRESVSQVADVIPGGESSNPYDFLQVGDSLYFLAQPDVKEGFQLFSVKADATVTSVRKIAFRSKTKLFPNPTADIFLIVAAADDPLTAVSIYDLQGRRVFAETATTSPFRAHVAGLAAGQYVVRLTYASGKWEHRTLAVIR